MSATQTPAPNDHGGNRDHLIDAVATKGRNLIPGLVIHAIVTELGDAHLDQPYRIVAQLRTSRSPLFLCENPAGFQIAFSPSADVCYLTTKANGRAA